MEYWDPEGVNTRSTGGGFTNGDGRADATYVWNGLTLFDNGGHLRHFALRRNKLLGYPRRRRRARRQARSGSCLPAGKRRHRANSGAAGSAGSSGTPLGTTASDGGASLGQQWSITSNGDGYLQIADLNVSAGATAQVLDNRDQRGRRRGRAKRRILRRPFPGMELCHRRQRQLHHLQQSQRIGSRRHRRRRYPAAISLQHHGRLDRARKQHPVVANCPRPHHRRQHLYATNTSSSFLVSQSSLTLATNASSTPSLTVTPSGSYQGTVSLSCSSTLAGVTCSFNPASLALDGSNKVVTGTVTITAPSSIAALQQPPGHTTAISVARLSAGYLPESFSC